MGRMLNKLRSRVQRGFQWLWRQEGSPGQRARGLAAGIFCGCFPLFGIQTLLGIGLASVVRGNHLLAAAGTWISNPFTYVPLYWFNYRVGVLFLGPGHRLPGLEEVLQKGLSQMGMSIMNRMLLGSSITGALFALSGWWLCLNWLRRKEKQHCTNAIQQKQLSE